MHILLVDDHAVVRQGYCALLTMMLPETRVDEAENAQQALKILGQQSVDQARRLEAAPRARPHATQHSTMAFASVCCPSPVGMAYGHGAHFW